MPGWKPLSIGYHGDNGGIYIESGKVTYHTNETFNDNRVGFNIFYRNNEIIFTTLGPAANGWYPIELEPHLLNAELYPCVGFHFAKDAIVRITMAYK